jgi:hypothetical protein
MVSQKERARLIATSGGKDPLYAAGTVIKCAVCLLFLCGLALIGTASGPLTERTAQPTPSHQGRITHAKELDTARQMRTESAQSTRTADHPPEPTVTRAVVFESSCQGAC